MGTATCQPVSRVLRGIYWGSGIVLKWVTITSFSVMGVAVLLQVFYRVVLVSGLAWPEELSRYLLVWTALLGGALNLHGFQTTAVRLLLERLPKRTRRVVEDLLICLGIAFCVFLFWFSLPFVRYGSAVSTLSLPVSMFWAFLAIPVAAAVMAVRLAISLVLSESWGIASIDDAEGGDVL